MVQSIKDHLSRIWQRRFIYGFSVAAGDIAINRYENGNYVVNVHGPSLWSPGTGHWPWYLLDLSYLTGPAGGWHIGLLGFTVGRTMVHTVDNETGEVVGPDRPKYYFFFKGINHYDKQFEEIINA